MSLVAHVFGARPNFVKLAPVIHALSDRLGLRQLLVHTGQHYDPELSESVLQDVGLPEPDRFLGVGSGTHAEQTGRVMVEVERLLLEERPEILVVGGDVNSTLGAALASAKVGVPIAHVESGLRSWDWSMPEEINRVLTDRLSALLFTHSPEAEQNLLREGIDPARIHYVGNTMIDTLRRLEPRARERKAWLELGLPSGGYLLVTLHRPSNVDDPLRLAALVDQLVRLRARFPIVFSVHPRTRHQLEQAGGLWALAAAGVVCTESLPYLDFLSLETAAGAILTDSGGLQEEASALGIRCYTLRRTTERPITLELGTNVLLGEDPVAIATVSLSAPSPREIPLWDGQAGKRAADVLVQGIQHLSEVPLDTFEG